MKDLNRIKSLFIGAGLALGLTLFTSLQAFGATYTVAAGDTLYKISKLFYTTTTTLTSDNKLVGSSIYPGQTLYVSCKTYNVQAGDSLYLIAKKYGTTIDALMAANHLSSGNIFIGQVLNVPIPPVQTQSPPPSSTGNIVYTASDVDLLARLITAEAQGEPYNAKVAVGAVVVNRVQSGSFPNTIHDVVYQRINGYYQFTPVLNGWINKPADADSVKAATAALNGSDPTNGALFYFDDSTTNTWLWSKPIAIIIDKLVFAY